MGGGPLPRLSTAATTMVVEPSIVSRIAHPHPVVGFASGRKSHYVAIIQNIGDNVFLLPRSNLLRTKHPAAGTTILRSLKHPPPPVAHIAPLFSSMDPWPHGLPSRSARPLIDARPRKYTPHNCIHTHPSINGPQNTLESTLQQPSTVNDNVRTGLVLVGDHAKDTLRIVDGVSWPGEGDAPLAGTRAAEGGRVLGSADLVVGEDGGHACGEVAGAEGVDADTEVAARKLGGELVRDGKGSGPGRSPVSTATTNG